MRSGRVLLIRRAKAPLRGRWMIPGGRLRLGEGLREAVEREVREETGVVVRARRVLVVAEHIERLARRVRVHFVIVDYACDYVSGVPRAGSDALAAAWVNAARLEEYDLPAPALAVVRAGLGLATRARLRGAPRSAEVE